MRYLSNPILRTDSYKHSHFLQYPDGAEYVTSYIEARGCDRDWTELVFLGLQGFLKEWLRQPVTRAHVIEAKHICAMHGIPFNEKGWMHIVDVHDGVLPIAISALPEGSIVPLNVPLVQVTNTDPKVPWLTSFVETALLRAIWYPTTVATQSREIKKLIAEFMDKTAGHREGLDFKLHDFGARGVSSPMSAAIGGFAHLVNFQGTDTIEGIMYAREFYGAQMAGFSIPASEHSTMTSWLEEGEEEAFERMLSLSNQASPTVACVSDSYDIYRACMTWGTTLKEKVEALAHHGGTLVVRPDSGDPEIVPVNCVSMLMNAFGNATNSLGYNVLPTCIRVIQGDGINEDSIRRILENMVDSKFSTENIGFGMGGALLQKVDRDTLKFAMKANSITINGEQRDVYKEPKTDLGKASKRGIQCVTSWMDGGKKEWMVYREDGPAADFHINQLAPVWANGKILIETTLDEIRERAAID